MRKIHVRRQAVGKKTVLKKNLFGRSRVIVHTGCTSEAFKHGLIGRVFKYFSSNVAVLQEQHKHEQQSRASNNVNAHERHDSYAAKPKLAVPSEY